MKKLLTLSALVFIIMGVTNREAFAFVCPSEQWTDVQAE